MRKSRVDEKQSVQLLEDNRLNEANMPELFVPSVYMPHFYHSAVYFQSLILQPYWSKPQSIKQQVPVSVTSATQHFRHRLLEPTDWWEIGNLWNPI